MPAVTLKVSNRWRYIWVQYYTRSLGALLLLVYFNRSCFGGVLNTGRPRKHWLVYGCCVKLYWCWATGVEGVLNGINNIRENIRAKLFPELLQSLICWATRITCFLQATRSSHSFNISIKLYIRIALSVPLHRLIIVLCVFLVILWSLPLNLVVFARFLFALITCPTLLTFLFLMIVSRYTLFTKSKVRAFFYRW